MAYKTGTHQKRLDTLDSAMVLIRTQALSAIAKTSEGPVSALSILGLLRFLKTTRAQIGNAKDFVFGSAAFASYVDSQKEGGVAGLYDDLVATLSSLDRVDASIKDTIPKDADGYFATTIADSVDPTGVAERALDTKATEALRVALQEVVDGIA